MYVRADELKRAKTETYSVCGTLTILEVRVPYAGLLAEERIRLRLRADEMGEV
jgi:hypothetical protein